MSNEDRHAKVVAGIREADRDVTFQGPLATIYIADNIPDARENYVTAIGKSYAALLRAARNGNGDASAAIAHMYLNRSIKCDDYLEEAINLASAAIESGSEYGKWVMGWALMEQRQAKEGIKYLSDALSHNFAPAAQDLGVIYQMGWGVPKDETTSRDYFRVAKKLGHINAQYYLLSLNVSGRFGLVRAFFSWMARPFAKLRWNVAVMTGRPLTQQKIAYLHHDRMSALYRS